MISTPFDVRDTLKYTVGSDKQTYLQQYINSFEVEQAQDFLFPENINKHSQLSIENKIGQKRQIKFRVSDLKMGEIENYTGNVCKFETRPVGYGRKVEYDFLIEGEFQNGKVNGRGIKNTFD